MLHRVAASHAAAALPLLRAPAASMLVATGKPANEVQCTVALVKNIVGSGVLTLPAGISVLSDRGAASEEVLVLSTVLLFLFGALNGLGFLLIGEACAATNEASYVGAWRSTVGKSTAWVPAFCSLCLTFLATVGCATVIGEVGTDTLAGVLGDATQLDRNAVLAGFAATCLLPLCLLPSLAPLGTASVLGVGGLVFTGGAMAIRYFDGSYVPGTGAFAADVAATPAFHEAASSSHLADLPPSAGAVFFFLSLVSNAYLAHYNAPGVFNECRRAERDRLKEAERERRAKEIGGVAQTGPLARGGAGAAAASGAGRAASLATAKTEDGTDGAASASASASVAAATMDGDDAEEEESLFVRLTSTLAAEEVNELFESYIESVPSFDRSLSASFETGFDEGYSAGYLRGFEEGVATAEAAAAAGAARGGSARDPPQQALSLASTADEANVGIDGGELLGLASFRRVVFAGFAISSALFLMISYAGFATFGDASQPIILNNYAARDPLAEIARVGILLAVIFEFPLLERPFRLTALELLLPLPQFTGAITSVANSPVAAIGSVALITSIAAAGLPLDIGGALAGSTGGALLIYVGPALMALKMRERRGGAEADAGGEGGAAAASAEPRDTASLGLYAMVVVGMLCAVLGTADTIGRI